MCKTSVGDGARQESATYLAGRLRVSTAGEVAEMVQGRPKQSLIGSGGFEPARDNSIRAGWAARALAAYATHLGGASLTQEVSVTAGDLLADLRHLFDALGLDWGSSLEQADVHYRAEVTGEL